MLRTAVASLMVILFDTYGTRHFLISRAPFVLLTTLTWLM